MNEFGIFFVLGRIKMNRKTVAEMLGTLIFFMGAIIIIQVIGGNAAEMQGLMDGAMMARSPVYETVLGAGLGFVVCGLGLWIFIKKD
jgi:hypothetical protein